MPPPPPPSKSYLLQLDTDTEDEEEDHSPRSRSEPPEPFPVKCDDEGNSKKEQADDGSGGGEEDEDTRDDAGAADITSSTQASASSRRRKRRKGKAKRKRNRRKNSPQPKDDDVEAEEEEEETKKEENNVSFGTVSFRVIERTLGGDGVPADGGWPLGLSEKILDDQADVAKVEEYEADRQKQLLLRWKVHSGDPPPPVLETRQWDYKRERDQRGQSLRNPLFMPLNEDQRHELLVHGKASPTPSKARKSLNEHQQKNKRQSGSNKVLGFMRTRSHSIDQTGDYDPMDVRHIRKELEDLRVERSKDGGTGCSCRKLQVPPPTKSTNSAKGVGKRVGHAKHMSINKVKEELRKRRKLPTQQMSRNELEELLYNIVQEEPCCSSRDCPCVRENLTCQADTCTCWVHAGSAAGMKEAPKSAGAIRELCGNQFGMYVVDSEEIKQYRQEMICQYVPDF